MRTDNIAVSITIPIPYDKPDLNGVVHTKEAILNALNNFKSNLPILFRANEGDSTHVIGNTDNTVYSIDFDDENQVCRFTINGNIYYGGISCFAHDIKDAKITDFEIMGIGLSN